MIVKNRRLIFLVLLSGFILLIPLIAMQFASEVAWNLIDFIIAGTLLLTTFSGIEFVMRKTNKVRTRIAISIAILFVFALIWVELAVGIFGTPISGS